MLEEEPLKSRRARPSPFPLPAKRGEGARRAGEGLGVVAALALLLALPAWAGELFTPAQMSALCGPMEGLPGQGDGAQVKTQYMYHYMRQDRDASVIKAPKWIDEMLPSMISRPVWQDPAEGVLNEAQLWQAPLSVLYEFFELVRKTFPPPQGQGLPPPALAREFADNRTRFRMSLDRLYRARLGDSLDGRGRTLLSYFDLIEKEYDSLMDAIVRVDGRQYMVAATAIGDFSNAAYDVMWSEPRGGTPAERPAPPGLLPIVLASGGLLMMFFAGLTLGTRNQEAIGQAIDDYWLRSQQWAQEFNRQFVAIKVHYLVVIPFAFFALLGALTLNLLAFFACCAIGLYVGLKTPMVVLNFIRQRRGTQVEKQLMDALTLLGNALKSGLDLVQGFQMVQRELLPPISDEFGLVIKNYQLGTPFEKALEGLEDRIESRLINYMVKAIVIQRQVGGNLIKIFDRIVENIREEAKLEEKIQALTAQQRIQSIVVGIMPWIMLGVMFMFQGPTMTRFYTSGLGMFILFFCGVWIMIGMKVVSALGQIKV